MKEMNTQMFATTDYKLVYDFDKRLEHKFNRLRGLIKQLAGFLGKQSNFLLRDDDY